MQGGYQNIFLIFGELIMYAYLALSSLGNGLLGCLYFKYHFEVGERNIPAYIDVNVFSRRHHVTKINQSEMFSCLK